MISTPEIAWVAGLLEGEASFFMSGRSIAITINMTDRDVIGRLAGLVGGRVYGPTNRRDLERGHQPIWRAQVKGPKAAGWMMTIYRLLGTRRRSQVRRALASWRAMRYVRIAPSTSRSIVETWDAGCHTKLHLARRFLVSRGTVYRVLREHARIEGVREAPNPRITPMDVAWLAGLIEGEGNISINGRSLTLRIKMGDRDIISRAADLLGGKVLSATVSDPTGIPMWLAQVKSTTAAAWIMTIYPWLGVRRRKQARDSLAFWKRQGHRAIAGALGDTIIAYRNARFSQSEIMAIFKISKSTVYRHTKDKVPRIRVTPRRGRLDRVRECDPSHRYGRANQITAIASTSIM